MNLRTCACALLLAAPAIGQFSLAETISLPGTNLGDLTTDGNHWFLAHALANGVYVYDRNGMLEREILVPVASDLRAVSYDPFSGNLFIGDFPTGTIHEMRLDGTIVNSFTVNPPSLNALAVNVNDGTLWAATFAGVIVHYDRTGTELSRFSTNLAWTGITVDPTRGRLLALETNDNLYEYDFSGNQIANPTIPAVAGNGFGLYYDPTRSLLLLASQFSAVSIMVPPDRPRVARRQLPFAAAPRAYGPLAGSLPWPVPRSGSPENGGMWSFRSLTRFWR